MTLLEQQTIAKTLLQASLQSCENSQQRQGKSDDPVEEVEGANGQISEYVISVARVEEEKDSATLQLKGMEAKCTRLEKELEERSVDKLDGEEEENATSHQQPSYESSSDLGIESGTEVEDSLSEK